MAEKYDMTAEKIGNSVGCLALALTVALFLFGYSLMQRLDKIIERMPPPTTASSAEKEK